MRSCTRMADEVTEGFSSALAAWPATGSIRPPLVSGETPLARCDPTRDVDDVMVKNGFGTVGGAGNGPVVITGGNITGGSCSHAVNTDCPA